MQPSSSPPNIAPGDTTQAPSDKHQAILSAAAEIFREHGFAAARISDIAKAAGVGKGTVYEYYRSKEELLLEVCLHICRKNELTMSAGEALNPSVGFGAPPGANPVRILHDTLAAVIETLLVSSRSEFRLFSDLQYVSSANPEVMAKAHAEIHAKLDQWRSYAQSQIEQGIAGGLLRELPDLAAVSRLVVASVDGLIWQQMWNTQDEPRDIATSMARTWCRLCMREPQQLEELLTCDA